MPPKNEAEDCEMLENPPAIFAENVTASYGKMVVVKNVSVAVELGTIYALLGPSGCGKTTLLSSILGRKKLDSGSILVNNIPIGDRKSGLPGPLVGFMPQDICLYQEFTIKETFQYFGTLQKMKNEQIKARLEELIVMLELPEKDREVRQMSGGQKRRLSFSVALLHKPKILILDEPTVGVDPVVRARVWDHLEDLCKSGVSTVITTHYVEEARQADMVGIMRQGTLLAQEQPTSLMMRWEVDSLEEAFLILCKQQTWDTPSQKEDEKPKTKPAHAMQNRKSSVYSFLPYLPSLSNMRAMTRKNWISMKRNLFMLYFIFLSPAILCIFDCIAVGQKPKTIDVAIVNLESNCSANVFDPVTCHPNMLGCHFQQTLNGTGGFKVKELFTEDIANRQAETGEVRAVFVIPEDFSLSYLKRILSSDLFGTFTYWNGYNGENIGEEERVSISLDMSDPAMMGFIKEAIMISLMKFQENLAKLCGEKYESYDVEFDFGIFNSLNATLGDEVVDYREYITSASVMMPVYFLAVARTAEAFIAERSQGLLERSWIAGVLPFEILVSFIVSQSLNVFIQVLIVIITVFVGFGLPCRGNIAGYIILVIFQGFTGLCNGFFFSTLCSTATDAIMLAVVNLFFSLFLCGIIWPVDMMPYTWLESLSWYLPHTAAMQGMRDITLRGWGMEAITVQLGMAVSLGWSFLFFAGSWLMIKIKLQ